MIQHVLRVKSPSDRAREAYFAGEITTVQYLRQALGAHVVLQPESPRAVGIRSCLVRAVKS